MQSRVKHDALLTVSCDVVSWKLLEVGAFKPLVASVNGAHHAGPRLLEHLCERAETNGRCDALADAQEGRRQIKAHLLKADQVSFAGPLQLLPRLVQDGRHHAEERERLWGHAGEGGTESNKRKKKIFLKRQ